MHSINEKVKYSLLMVTSWMGVWGIVPKNCLKFHILLGAF